MGKWIALALAGAGILHAVQSVAALDALGEQIPIAAAYNYHKGPVVLRLTKALTPTQADEYRKVFEAAIP